MHEIDERQRKQHSLTRTIKATKKYKKWMGLLWLLKKKLFFCLKRTFCKARRASSQMKRYYIWTHFPDWNTFQRCKLHFFWNLGFFWNFLLWNSFKEYDLAFIICTFRLDWSKLLNTYSKNQNQALLITEKH